MWTPSSRFRRFVTIALVAMLVCQSASVAVAASPGHTSTLDPDRASPASRAASLSPGMNLPWWFWFAGPPWDASMIDTGYSQANLDGFFNAGIRGVRLPVDFFLLTKSTDRSQLDPGMMAKVDAAIQKLLATGFNVILDNHNAPEESGGTDISDRLFDDAFVALFTDYWGQLAERYASIDANRLIFEPLNEPIFQSAPERWTVTVLPAIVDAIRSKAPDHTILLSAPNWSSVSGVVQMRPDLIGDANVIYNLHFYEPFVMTHQGAGWVGTPFEELGGLPYPSSPEAVAPVLLAKTWSDEARWNIENYGEERWNRDKVAALIGQAVDWARDNEVVLMTTEFGVYMEKSPPLDAARLVRDMRETFEANGIPWMVWSDNGGFGFHRADFSYVTTMLIALGLRPGTLPEPAITASTTEATVSAPISISVSGFPANTTVQVRWDRNTTIRTVTTNNQGAATFTARVPRSTRGDHVLTIRTAGGSIAVSRVIHVVPSLTLVPDSGDAGSTTIVRLNGYSAGETVRIRWSQGSSGATLATNVVINAVGSAAKTVTIPTSARIGASTIRTLSSAPGARGSFRVTGIAAADLEPSPAPTGTAMPTPSPTAEPTDPPVTTPEVTPDPVTPPAGSPTPDPTATTPPIPTLAPTAEPTPAPQPEATPSSAETPVA